MLAEHAGLQRVGDALERRVPIPPGVDPMPLVRRLAVRLRAVTCLAWDMHFVRCHVPVVEGVLLLRTALRADGFLVEVLSVDRPCLVSAPASAMCPARSTCVQRACACSLQVTHGP